MKTERITIFDREITRIKADEGKTFRRKHDDFEMGSEIMLGIDYSTGQPREDKPEYYEEVDTYEEQ